MVIRTLKPRGVAGFTVLGFRFSSNVLASLEGLNSTFGLKVRAF